MRLLVVGAGLIGASVAAAATRAGHQVWVADVDPDAVATVIARGDATPAPDDADPDLVAVAVPPTAAPSVVTAVLRRCPAATVTDLTSVKAGVLAVTGTDRDRFVSSHPMAGSERSGAGAADPVLFRDRTWVVLPYPEADEDRVALVERLAADCGAVVRRWAPDLHDAAVAVTSHLPQLVGSVLAGRLEGLPVDGVALSGQGLRDMTRIAGSDPGLWTEILSANAARVAEALELATEDLEDVAGHLRVLAEAPGDRAALAGVRGLLERGNAGYARIPVRHGTGVAGAILVVRIEDRPGELARLLTFAAEAGANVLELRLEHAYGRPTGLVELTVPDEQSTPLREALQASGWTVAT